MTPKIFLVTQIYTIFQENLYKTESVVKGRRSKSASIVDQVENRDYERKCLPEIMQCSKQETRISRFKMLECKNKYKGFAGDLCYDCQVIDDENQ